MLKYLVELRNRFLFIFLTIVSVSNVSYFYKEMLLFLILTPIENSNCKSFLFYFIFTSITEMFSAYLHLIYFIVLQTAYFFSAYHFFIFFSLALFKKEYQFCFNLLKVSFFMWLSSMFVSNYIVIPLTWDFFFSFQNQISSKFITLFFEPKIVEYLVSCITVYSLSNFYCQFFAFLIFFIEYYSTSIYTFKKFRKLYYYGLTVFSTIISPPDIFSQLLSSLCFVYLFELRVLIFLLKKNLIR